MTMTVLFFSFLISVSSLFAITKAELAEELGISIAALQDILDETGKTVEELKEILDEEGVETLSSGAVKMPDGSKQFARDINGVIPLLGKMLDATGEDSLPPSGSSEESTEDKNKRDFISIVKQHQIMYGTFVGDMNAIDKSVNAGESLAGSNSLTGSSYGGTSICLYCSSIPAENSTYNDPLSPIFIETANDSTKIVQKLVKEASGLEKEIYQSELDDYKNLTKDYKIGDFFSVKTNSKYMTVLTNASKTLLIKSKSFINKIKKKKKCKAKKCENLDDMLDKLNKIKPQKLVQNFNKKIEYGIITQRKYMKDKAPLYSRAFKNKTIDGLYPSGTSLFARIHRNYTIRRMAGMFLLKTPKLN